MAHGWSSSNRRSRLPADWQARRNAVATRAGHRCECQGDCGQHADRCVKAGTDCDHIVRGDNHSLGNLQWLCPDCHKAKTKREAAAAYAAQRAKLTHPSRNAKHPGLL